MRIEFFGDEIEAIDEIDPLRGELLTKIPTCIYPASHYVTAEDLERALIGIRDELEERLAALRGEGKLLEAQRLEQRTRYDLEMLEEIGFCSGIENYSRHLDGRKPGEPPSTLLDYFPEDFLLIIDESHVTVPQIGACTAAMRARNARRVRLPAAQRARQPAAQVRRVRARMGQVVYVSATPADSS